MWPIEYLNTEDEDGVYWYSSPFEPLNNWSAHAVKIWDKEFKTAEHAYHWAKYKDDHPEIAKQIADSPSPYAAFAITREHMNKRPKDWDSGKKAVMTEIVIAKHAQNKDVQDVLIRTGSRVIYENSLVDSYWGAGADGKGQNMMGQIWMSIRDE